MIAVGVVLIYRTTRIINFAVANMGVVGAATLSLLTLQYHVPFWAPGHRAAHRRGARRPGGIGIIGGCARHRGRPFGRDHRLGQVMQVIGDEIPLPSNESAHYPAGLPVLVTGGMNIRGSDLDILILVPLAIIALAWFLERTLLGKTVKRAPRTLSWPDLLHQPKLVSTMVWALGAALRRCRSC